jgi:hypothetical protein
VGETWLITLDVSIRPWVLGNLSYETVNLERWANLSERRIFINIFLSVKHPNNNLEKFIFFYTPFFNFLAEKMFLDRKKILEGHLPPPPHPTTSN